MPRDAAGRSKTSGIVQDLSAAQDPRRAFIDACLGADGVARRRDVRGRGAAGTIAEV